MHRVILPLVLLLAALAASVAVSYVNLGGSFTVTAAEPAEAAKPTRRPVDVTRVPVPAEDKYRVPAQATVRFVEAQAVPALCGAPGIPTVIACVDDIGGSVITLPNPCSPEFIGEDYAAVVCHEKGHILGWRHEMPSFFPAPEKG